MTMQKLSLNPRELRRQLGLSQQKFWAAIQVTQSGGSRYESGRALPPPVRELMRLVHIERLELTKINREDMDILERLKIDQPHVYQSLRREIESMPMRTAISIRRGKPAVPDRVIHVPVSRNKVQASS